MSETKADPPASLANLELASLSSLKTDPRNSNKGTERGSHMLSISLEKYGAGRSILSDRNGTVIAGNKTLEQWAEMGMDEIINVHTTGKQLVNVIRDDLDLETDPAAVELAHADNRVSQVSYEPDLSILAELAQDPAIDLTPFYFPDELAELLAGPQDTPPADGEEPKDYSDQISEKYMVMIDCGGELEQLALLEELNARGLTCRALMS